MIFRLWSSSSSSGLGLEPEEAVVGLGPLPDLVGELAHPPGPLGCQAAGRLDPLARLRGDLVASLVRGLRVEHQHEFVVRRCQSGG